MRRTPRNRTRGTRRAITTMAVSLALIIALSPSASGEPHPQGESLACGQEINRTDENGTFRLRFQCLPAQGLLNWGFTFNERWRAMAISPVTESGMRYWQNGVRPPDNSDRVVPIDYFFHGTIPAVFVGDNVEYQDYFTFRANFGADNGTARVAIAGSVILKP